MGLFDKIKGCKILKESTCAESELAELNNILQKCPESEKSKLQQVIRNLEYGIKGEQAILFELKNSGFPMLVLQDLYLEHEDLAAQIDFLIITRDKIYVIESKNMYGDVVVTSDGDFMRKINGKSSKIYSPITQCERHLSIIKQIRYNAKSNIIAKAMFEKFSGNTYRTLVVMANPTGKINTKYAPKDIKNKIISVDQLVRHIKKNHNSSEETFENHIIALGDFFLSIHKENPQNYMNRYRELLNDEKDSVSENVASDETVSTKIPEEKTASSADTNQTIICSRCGADMVLRVAKKGNNVGEEFYGCSSYPKCRNIVKKED